MKLALLTTHPIQYHAGWFRGLSDSAGVDLQVFYCHQATPKEQAAAGFGVEFQWDVSLTNGYSHRFLNNVAQAPRVNSFSGLDTPEIKSIIANEQFDAVLINGWHYKSAWQAMRACWKTRTPVMVRSDSHLHSLRSSAKKTAKWPFYRWFIPRLDACLAAGQWSTEYFLYYGAKRDRVFTVPHVIDTDHFRNAAEALTGQRELIRQSWNLAGDATVFLFAGKFIELKRPFDFIKAIAVANDRGRRVVGLMVGDGPERERCQRYAEVNNVPVTFAGFLNQSEMIKAYVASDVLILPSDSETWGLVVNEAMACGCPCIVADSVGCNPDMIMNAVTGFTFPRGDVSALAALIEAVANDPDNLTKMKAQAKQKAEAYSVPRGVEAVLRAAHAAMLRKPN